MSRWKYKTATVTVGDNSQDVRQLTQSERAEFAASSQKIKKGEMQPIELPPLVVGFAAINPKLTKEEVADMPGDLMDACVDRIMELSGLGDDDKAPAAAGTPEKKDP